MKFLVLNGKAREPAAPATAEGVETYYHTLRELVGNGVVDAPHVILGGGHLYVCEAEGTWDLAAKVRYNPLFRSCRTEVIPVIDVREALGEPRDPPATPDRADAEP